jgi:hypothetical protein
MLANFERERDQRLGYKMRAYFPDTGPYRRELYPRHMQFIAYGTTYRERLFIITWSVELGWGCRHQVRESVGGQFDVALCRARRGDRVVVGKFPHVIASSG